MKKIVLMMALIGFTATIQKATAQVRISASINIGTQPDWGPAGYDYVDYYYMPAIDVYYYVPSRQFVYFSNGRWIFGASLPTMYRSYNLYNTYKVVINEPTPYLHHEVYKIKYAKYKGWNGKQSYNKNNGKYKTYKSRGNSNKNSNKGRGNH